MNWPGPMLINFVDATNDANDYTKPPPLLVLDMCQHSNAAAVTERNGHRVEDSWLELSN